MSSSFTKGADDSTVNVPEGFHLVKRQNWWFALKENCFAFDLFGYTPNLITSTFSTWVSLLASMLVCSLWLFTVAYTMFLWMTQPFQLTQGETSHDYTTAIVLSNLTVNSKALMPLPTLGLSVLLGNGSFLTAPSWINVAFTQSIICNGQAGAKIEDPMPKKNCATLGDNSVVRTSATVCPDYDAAFNSLKRLNNTAANPCGMPAPFLTPRVAGTFYSTEYSYFTGSVFVNMTALNRDPAMMQQLYRGSLQLYLDYGYTTANSLTSGSFPELDQVQWSRRLGLYPGTTNKWEISLRVRQVSADSPWWNAPALGSEALDYGVSASEVSLAYLNTTVAPGANPFMAVAKVYLKMDDRDYEVRLVPYTDFFDMLAQWGGFLSILVLGGIPAMMLNQHMFRRVAKRLIAEGRINFNETTRVKKSHAMHTGFVPPTSATDASARLAAQRQRSEAFLAARAHGGASINSGNGGTSVALDRLRSSSRNSVSYAAPPSALANFKSMRRASNASRVAPELLTARSLTLQQQQPLLQPQSPLLQPQSPAPLAPTRSIGLHSGGSAISAGGAAGGTLTREGRTSSGQVTFADVAPSPPPTTLRQMSSWGYQDGGLPALLEDDSMHHGAGAGTGGTALPSDSTARTPVTVLPPGPVAESLRFSMDQGAGGPESHQAGQQPPQQAVQSAGSADNVVRFDRETGEAAQGGASLFEEGGAGGHGGGAYGPLHSSMRRTSAYDDEFAASMAASAHDNTLVTEVLDEIAAATGTSIQVVYEHDVFEDSDEDEADFDDVVRHCTSECSALYNLRKVVKLVQRETAFLTCGHMDYAVMHETLVRDDSCTDRSHRHDRSVRRVAAVDTSNHSANQSALEMHGNANGSGNTTTTGATSATAAQPPSPPVHPLLTAAASSNSAAIAATAAAAIGTPCAPAAVHLHARVCTLAAADSASEQDLPHAAASLKGGAGSGGISSGGSSGGDAAKLQQQQQPLLQDFQRSDSYNMGAAANSGGHSLVHLALPAGHAAAATAGGKSTEEVITLTPTTLFSADVEPSRMFERLAPPSKPAGQVTGQATSAISRGNSTGGSGGSGELLLAKSGSSVGGTGGGTPLRGEPLLLPSQVD